MFPASEKTGFLGGTFDPLHIGHLIIAQDAREQLGLDQVYFVPAARAPLKDRQPEASDAQRMAMIQAAIEGQPHLAMLDWEMQASGKSYTVNTARQLRDAAPDAPLFWIIGGDQVAQLSEWHAIEELAGLIDFIAVERPGHHPEPRHSIPNLRLHHVRGHAISLSSTNVRERFAAGLDNDLFLPPPVAEYITNHNLYRKCANSYGLSAN